MSHFYGTLQGSRGRATRCGTKASSYAATAASWAGCVTVDLRHNDVTGRDEFHVHQEKWRGHGVSETLAHGVLGDSTSCPEVELTAVRREAGELRAVLSAVLFPASARSEVRARKDAAGLLGRDPPGAGLLSLLVRYVSGDDGERFGSDLSAFLATVADRIRDDLAAHESRG